LLNAFCFIVFLFAHYKNITVSLALFDFAILTFDNMKIVLVGSGNAATVIGRVIKSAKHTIVQVMSKQLNHAQSLAAELYAEAITNADAITKDADIYIICVWDNEIENIASQLFVKNKIVMHTSGAVSKNILKKSSENFGVLYPLQSLRKELNYIPDIPFLIDGNSAGTIQTIEAFAKSFSKKVSYANDEDRLKLHVAAVIVSNFTNHLYSLAKGYCEQEKTDFSLLVPLIKEVAHRTENYEPENMQTGPAVRDDEVTISRHLEMLSAYPNLQKIYSHLTGSIQLYHRLK
jgi:predicted short-subunit dehydrogenase-like oxidoreductase (DUF2520 family)